MLHLVKVNCHRELAILMCNPHVRFHSDRSEHWEYRRNRNTRYLEIVESRFRPPGIGVPQKVNATIHWLKPPLMSIQHLPNDRIGLVLRAFQPGDIDKTTARHVVKKFDHLRPTT